MEINLVNQTAIMIMFAVSIGLFIVVIGFLGLQHQKLFEDIDHTVNSTEHANLKDRAHSDNLTRIIILNVTGEASNSTKAVLKNITSQIELHNELVNAKIDRAIGVAIRTHNDVQQVLHWLLNMTNNTGRIINILPDFR